MAVKGTAAGGEPEEEGMETEDRGGDGLPAGVETDLGELLRVMPRVFRGMRRADPGADATGRSSALKDLFKGGTLGPRHIPVLVVLALNGPQTVGDLARRLSLNLATVSVMVSELSRAGLVERHEDERDRRRTLVNITERYRRRLAPFVEQRVAPLRRALERMSPEVRQAFLAGWRLLADEIERSANGSEQ